MKLCCAGTNVWMLSDSAYPDYDQFGIFGSAAGVAQPQPEGRPLTAAWAQTLARRATFRGFVAIHECVRRRYQSVPGYVDGWQETLKILSAKRTFAGQQTSGEEGPHRRGAGMHRNARAAAQMRGSDHPVHHTRAAD